MTPSPNRKRRSRIIAVTILLLLAAWIAADAVLAPGPWTAVGRYLGNLFSQAGPTRDIARVVRRAAGEQTRPVTLRVWDWWADSTTEDYAKYFGELERIFEQRHPDVDVVFQSVPFSNYEQKLATGMLGASPPDVFQCSVSWAQGLYDRGILHELNDFVARTPELQDDQFMPSALYHSRKNGRIYGIPHIVDAGCLLWNLDMLRADPELHGMFETAPDGTPDFTRIRFDAVKDWDDFRRIATRLTRMRSEAEAVELGAAAKNLQQYGFQINAYGGGAGLFIRWIPSNGVKFQDATGTRALFDTAGTVETLNFLAGLYYDAKVCPKFSRDLTSHGRFEERSVACAPGGTWDGKYIVRDTEGWMGFGMTAYPPGPSGPGYKTLTWANMMAMSARTKIPDIAWDYIRLNCSLEGALLKLKHLNQNSPRLDFYAGDVWADEVRKRPYLSNVKRICESGDPLLHTQTQAALDEVLPIVEYLLLNWQDMQAGKGAYASAAEAVHTAAQRVDEVYTRYGRLVQGWQRPAEGDGEGEGR